MLQSWIWIWVWRIQKVFNPHCCRVSQCLQMKSTNHFKTSTSPLLGHSNFWKLACLNSCPPGPNRRWNALPWCQTNVSIFGLHYFKTGLFTFNHIFYTYLQKHYRICGDPFLVSQRLPKVMIFPLTQPCIRNHVYSTRQGELRFKIQISLPLEGLLCQIPNSVLGAGGGGVRSVMDLCIMPRKKALNLLVLPE